MPPFVVVRHAESTWNAEGRWQGQADPPLSERGRRQAMAATSALCGVGVDLVVSSDLARARQTAELLIAGMGLDTSVLTDPGLREYDAGQWSGLTRDEIAQQWPDQLARFDHGELAGPPGGELRRDFDARVRHASERVATLAIRSQASQVLIATHGGVIHSMARQAGLPDRHITFLSGYAGVVSDGGLQVADAVDLLEEPEHPGMRVTVTPSR